jgi:hypothetical protein
MAGGWRILHNEEPHNLYASQNTFRLIKSRRMSRVRHIASVGDNNCIKLLVAKPEGKGPRGKPQRRWEGNIRMIQVEVFWVESRGRLKFWYPATKIHD